ncbi:MAG: DNA polymerase III subunit beta [Patescibacteria group bacterium]|nr:DNA polymerase III subunit beta [Patescibacteria group bacterium]
MKIICTQENLKSGLLAVGRIISSNSSLPILGNVLMETENGLLKISSTNLEVAIITHIRCKVEEGGGVTVFSKTITDLVSNLPNKNITLQTQNQLLSIEAENYHTSVKTLPAEEFPLIPQIESSQNLEFDAQEFKEAVDQVVFAASLNQTQPEISGILVSLAEGEVKITATDRYRLAEKKLNLGVKNSGSRKEVIVPQKTMAELSRIIGSQKGKISMIMGDNQVTLQFNDTQIISRVVDGQYPDYKSIIPTEFSTEISIEKQALTSALRTTGIFSQNTNSVKLEYGADKQLVTLITESQDLGKSVVDLASEIKGESGGLVLNYHYILDCLQNLDVERIILKITNESSASLIVPEGQDDYIYLVMPIKS